ncbi:hypothetical protein G6F62_003885 [Rhizopus arrhizus]|uniref:F-box domain-containing protein n=1 Tax=Rhizopus oryzae TaxID=64495 RepID=A0A9P6XE94_RHIOR|nr:hypothetical protein G6F23_011559 [Rhizopus arrhizus]KAG0753617.1 hypothetical protein G6F24_012889 [Rhizopus arrhizus]KAG1311829.1 hypothetical protein G6F64_003505 [Rhizopus arrhizus]KAG1348331.1 hypothetical protein G6F62_003885 [Rhizopus arrhizus]
MSTINDLPNEVLSKIFSLLRRSHKYKCLLVNRRFYSVAVLELWKSITIYGYENDKTARCLGLFCIRIGERVKRLKLGYGPDHLQIICILSYLPNLEELVLSKTPNLIEREVLQIPKYCKHLESLALSKLEISNQSLLSFDQCHLLKRLKFSSCPYMTPDALTPFIGLPIESLTIHECDWIRFTNTALYIRLFSNLIQLDVDSSLINLAGFLRIITVDDADMPYLPRLQYFSIGSGTHQGNDLDIAIISFLRTHPRIRYLKLRSNQISNYVFDAITRYLLDLETFIVRKSTSTSAKNARKIVYLCSKLLYVEIHRILYTKYDFPEVHHLVRNHRLTLCSNDLKRIRANQYTNIINN